MMCTKYVRAKAAEEDKITNNIFRKYVVALILRIIEYIFCCKCQCHEIHIFS